MVPLLLGLIGGSRAAAEPPAVNPHPRRVAAQKRLAQWEFDKPGGGGWSIERDAKTRFGGAAGVWTLEAIGTDPILISPPLKMAPRCVVTLRMRTTAHGSGQIFWIGQEDRGPSEEYRSNFRVPPDGQWHTCEVECPFDRPLRLFRLDPATEPGEVEIDWIRVEQRTHHPVEIESIAATGAGTTVHLRNYSAEVIAASVNRTPVRLEPGALTSVALPAGKGALLWTQEIRVEVPGFPPLERVITGAGPGTGGIELGQGPVRLRVDPQGAYVGIRWGERELAYLGPLVAKGDRPVRLRAEVAGDGRIRFQEDGGMVHGELCLQGEEIRWEVRAKEEIESPVLRTQGALEQGLLAGVEHLGKGERSSSDLDIRGPERLRFAPDPMLLTMPLAVVVTPELSLAMRWEDPALRPIFAAPNFFEGTADHRVALRGKQIRVAIRVGPGFPENRLEDAVLWAVRKRGLPELPAAPRGYRDQLALCRAGFEKSAVAAESGGWYHAVVPGGLHLPDKPQFFADHLSSLFRIRNEVPKHSGVVWGGGHVENGTIYFVTGRAAEWLRIVENRAKHLLSVQRPDGSFRYDGKYAEGHFEDTSSGQCAGPARQLLAYARATGDEASKDAGLKALEFMKRFRTPRGAQVWECPLHAPDVLASAYLVKAYTLGYELTGNGEWRDLAVRWALSGVPFVYQWSNQPIMAYATTPTLCATNWTSPVWVGLPVQWCGLVYADALLDLALHDRTLDWRKLAQGILISGEQQMYPDGPSIGLLPDSFALADQQRRPANINPATIADLRMRLEGDEPGLLLAVDGGHRVLSPFPLKIDGAKGKLDKVAALPFQVLVDGSRVVDVPVGSSDVMLEAGP